MPDFSALLQEDLQLEKLLLSFCVIGLDETSREEIVASLVEEDFTTRANRTIFAAIKAMHASGTYVDLVTLGHYLIDKEQLAIVGGMSYIVDLDDRLGTISGVGQYIERIKELSRTRRAVAMLAAAEKEICNYGADTKILDRIEQQFADLSLESNSTEPPFSKASKIVQDVGGIGNFVSKQGEAIPTPFDWLTDMLGGGLRSGDMMILAARPSVGKSAVAGQFAEHVASMEEPRNVLIFPVETGADPFIRRMVCSRIGCTTHMIEQPDCSPVVREKFIREMAKVGEWPIYYDTKNLSGWPDIARAIRQFTISEKDSKPPLIIIDYLQLVSLPGRWEAEHQQVGAICRQIKLLANKTGAAFLILSQLTRPDRDAPNKRPTLDRLRQSGEEAADIVMFLHQDEDQKGAAYRMTNCKLAKQRNGPIDEMDMIFDSRKVRLVGKLEAANAPPEKW